MLLALQLFVAISACSHIWTLLERMSNTCVPNPTGDGWQCGHFHNDRFTEETSRAGLGGDRWWLGFSSLWSYDSITARNASVYDNVHCLIEGIYQALLSQLSDSDRNWRALEMGSTCVPPKLSVFRLGNTGKKKRVFLTTTRFIFLPYVARRLLKNFLFPFFHIK